MNDNLLSKIRLGEVDWTLKDAEARKNIEEMKEDLYPLPSDTPAIVPLPSEVQYELTRDVRCLRYKTYYKYDSVTESYVPAVKGVDYDVGDLIEDVEESGFFEPVSYTYRELGIERLNQVIGVTNLLIPAHKEPDTEGGAS